MAIVKQRLVLFANESGTKVNVKTVWADSSAVVQALGAVPSVELLLRKKLEIQSYRGMNNKAPSANDVDKCFAGAAMELIAKKIHCGIGCFAQGLTYQC